MPTFKRSTLATALAIAGFSFSAYATGLGELHSRSSLGDRFDAQIPVLGLESGSVDGLKATIAPVSAYEAMGLEFPSVLFHVRVDVEQQGESSVIHLYSSQRVTEPILDLVLRLEAPGGNVQRHYTVLLDLPSENAVAASTATLSSAQTQALTDVTPATQTPVLSAGAAPTAVVAERPRRKTPRVAVTPAQTIALDAAQYGPVRRGESLWTIANSLRQRYGKSQFEMMSLLRQNNPQAFANGDENLLQAGAVLKLPAGAVLATVASPQTTADAAAAGTLTSAHADAAAAVPASAVDAEYLNTLNAQNQALRDQITLLNSKIAELESRIGQATTAGSAAASPEAAPAAPQDLQTESATVEQTPATTTMPAAAVTPEPVANANPQAPAAVDSGPASLGEPVRVDTGRSGIGVWVAGGLIAVLLLMYSGWWLGRKRGPKPHTINDEEWQERKRRAREEAQAMRDQLRPASEPGHQASDAAALHGGGDAMDIKLQYVRSAVDTFLLFQRYREALSFLRREVHEAGGADSPLGARLDALYRETREHLQSIGVDETLPDGSSSLEIASNRELDDKSIVTPIRKRTRLK